MKLGRLSFLLIMLGLSVQTILLCQETPTATPKTPNKTSAWVFFSPNKVTEQAVIKFILGTRKELRIAAYSLTNEPISNAISGVEKSGAKVSLLCDKQQSQIASARCVSLGGRVDKRSGLMHHKFIVRDDQCILTGSFNFTNNAVYKNRENFIIICNDKLTKIYKDEFDRLYAQNT